MAHSECWVNNCIQSKFNLIIPSVSLFTLVIRSHASSHCDLTLVFVLTRTTFFYSFCCIYFLILLTGWICVITSLKILILCRNIEISLMENLREVFKLRWCILYSNDSVVFLWQITLWSYLEAIERYESLISMWRRSSWTRFHLIVSLFVCVCMFVVCFYSAIIIRRSVSLLLRPNEKPQIVKQ